jgi:Ca-activated chloride channel family protein
MRFAILALVFLPSALAAQGRIIPPPCLLDRCPRPMPAQVVRTGSDVRVTVADRVLQYEVEERFVNRGSRLGEADYLFPLPKGAAFQDLKLSIDGKLIAGEILPADRARGIYEEIVRRERDPALVEWMGHGLLRTRIFPIAPGEEKRVVVRFQAVAEREGDAVRIDYFSGGEAVRGARSAVSEGDFAPARTASREPRTTFTLSYRDDGTYGPPYSPTHGLRSSRRGDMRVVETQGDASGVTILLPLRLGREASISVIPHAPGREDGFALIRFTPPARRVRSTPRDLTFVVDVSGSMSGDKLRQAKAAGKQMLATLRPDDRFRIIDFASDVRTFRDDFVIASRANVTAAGRYLDSLDAQGGTNIEGALREALAAPMDTEEGQPVSRLPVILFVTDGEPSVGERRPEELAAQAAARRGRARIFTFGLGADVNVTLLERLAIEGHGTAQFVRPDEDVERMVGVVASRLTDPVVTDLRVRADGVRLTRMHPAGPVDVFAGQDMVIFARYEGSGPATIRFEGTTADGRASWTQRVDLPERERGNVFVPRLWATQRIGYLSAERRRYGGSPETDAEIRELGERYGIPTEFSSYLVQEPTLVAQQRDAMGRRRSGAGSSGMGRAGARVEAAPAAAAERLQTFDAAKVAGAQRAVTSLAAADSIGEGAAEAAGVRRVGGRIFVQRDGKWVDAGYHEGMRVVRIKAFSSAYFACIDRLPELASALTVGERTVVAGRAVAIEVGDDGDAQLDARALDLLVRDW